MKSRQFMSQLCLGISYIKTEWRKFPACALNYVKQKSYLKQMAKSLWSKNHKINPKDSIFYN